MNVLMCAMVPRDGRFMELMQKQPVDFPACVIVGKQDRFYQDGKVLASLYAAPQLFEHDGGHDFPSHKDPVHDEWIGAVRRRLT